MSGVPPNGFDTRAVRRHFGRAAERYAAHARVQREVGARLAESLAVIQTPPAVIVDLGAGVSGAPRLLAERWPGARIVAIDSAPAMLSAGRRAIGLWQRLRLGTRVAWLGGDARALPLAASSVDLVHSNLCLQWCAPLAPTLREIRRVLAPGGALLFSTFGPRTLEELAAAWRTVDGSPHTSALPDMPEIGDALLAAGFANPVLDIDRLDERYPSPRAVLDGLKAIGATHASSDRRRGLTGRRAFQAMLDAYAATADAAGEVIATFEVIQGLAFAPTAEAARRTGSASLGSISVEALRGSRIKRS